MIKIAIPKFLAHNKSYFDFKETVTTNFDKLNMELSQNTFNRYIDFENLLSKGEVDGFLWNLESAPYFDIKDQYCITAILSRVEIQYSIYSSDPALIQKLRANDYLQSIIVKDEAEIGMFKTLFDHNQFTVSSDGALPSYNCETILCLTQDGEDKLNEFPFSYPLNRKEMITNSGEGFMVFICHKDDISTRKALLPIHDSTLVSLANTERSITKICKQQYGIDTRAYCYRDNKGYHHVHAIRLDDFSTAKFSQSTAHQLDKKLLDQWFG